MTKFHKSAEEVKKKRTSVCADLGEELYDEFVSYANKHTQGNQSYAVRLAIKLLLTESKKIKIPD